MPKEKKQKEPKPKKPIFKRWWFWVIVVLVVCFIAIPTDSNNSNSQPSAAPTATHTAAPEKTPEPTPAPTAEPTTEPTPAPTPKPTLTPTPTPRPTPVVTPEPIRDKEWLSHVTPKDLKTNTGDILDVTYNGTDLIVKQKINSLLNNKQTVDQNYFNACAIIRSLGGAEIRDLQYWAVADMRDGSESKVISFTVPADTVKTIQTQQFPDNTLGNYVKDLWILPSLQN